MESTAETIRIRTPTEVMAPACRRVSTRAKVPTSPSPWSRSGWPEPPLALHRHAAAAARAADKLGTASRCPYTGTGRPRGRHTRSRAGRPGGVGRVVSGLASADGRASPACPRASCGSRPPRASVRSAACRAVEWWHTRTTARGRRPRPRRFAKRYASSCALVRSQRCWLSVSSRFLLVLQPLSSRSSAANGGLIVGTAVAARGLHEPQQRGYGTSGPTALAERQRSLVGRSEDRHWGLGSSSGVRPRARPECVAQSDRARRPGARLAAQRRADPECTARLAGRRETLHHARGERPRDAPRPA